MKLYVFTPDINILSDVFVTNGPEKAALKTIGMCNRLVRGRKFNRLTPFSSNTGKPLPLEVDVLTKELETLGRLWLHSEKGELIYSIQLTELL